jgi:SprT protein
MKKTTNKRQVILDKLKAFVPTGFEEMVVNLLFENPVSFKIVAPRSTKLGDFRAGMNGEKSQITVNGDLNPYAFLITTLHEFAHLKTYLEFGHRVKPHGEEWKNSYRSLLLPAIDSGLLPKDILNALVVSLTSTKASSCSDVNLTRVLRTYDKPKEGVVLLESLPKNTTFVLQGKHFRKGELRRKRYLCDEISSNKKYLVHALTEVKPLI